MGTDYNLSKIRTLLTESFTDQELRLFCYETPGFRPVYDQLAASTGKAEIISRLLEFAERREYLDPLLAWANEQNPAQYAKHQPYEAPTRAGGATLPIVQLTSSQPLRVFLCHASGDKPAVRDLYQRLSQEGFIQPWLDEEELLPGQDWQREIPKAVRASDVVLVCLSPQSVTKAGYVQKEIKFALDIADEQPEGTIFLIPLRLELCDVPERLQRWHWANLFEARGYERLLRSLRRRAEAIGINVTLRPQAEESPPSRVIPESPQPTPAPPPPESQVVSSPPAEKPPANQGTLHSVQRDMEVVSPPAPDRVTITHPIHLELVRVPAGEFLMGSDPAKDKAARDDEQPQHRVYVSEFYIGKYPVTNEQYAAFVKATKHAAPGHWEKGKIPSAKENHPVIYVSWDDAMAFCHWLSQATGQSFRLPTEAQWEKAARGPDGRIYPWGNQWAKTKLNSRDGGPGHTTPVGRYSPRGDSPYGAADMAGNVWEWSADWYGEKEYQRRAKSVMKDPSGPKQGGVWVLRGGAFDSGASWVRCAARDWDGRYHWRWGRGLRVVGSGPFPSESLNH